MQSKKINKDNAPIIHYELFKILGLGNIPVDTDIMYAFVPGYKTPLLLFRHSLHSFAQLSNAIDKIRRAGIEIKSVYLWPAPFKRGAAVFGDTKGKHLAAFRLVYVRSMP